MVAECGALVKSPERGRGPQITCVTPGTRSSPASFAKRLDLTESTLSINSMMPNQKKAEAMRPSNPTDALSISAVFRNSKQLQYVIQSRLGEIVSNSWHCERQIPVAVYLRLSAPVMIVVRKSKGIFRINSVSCQTRDHHRRPLVFFDVVVVSSSSSSCPFLRSSVRPHSSLSYQSSPSDKSRFTPQ